MSQLPTLDDLLRRKASERAETARPYERALNAERDLAAANVRYWLLLEEFVARARELGVQPQTWRASHGASSARFAWIEGYPLTGGALVSSPPLRYCVTERRLVFRPQHQVHEVEELSLFVASADHEATRGAGDLEQQTASRGGWPRLDRLDRTAQTLTALERELEASLLALMD
jgi:hypothetical protein